MRALFARVSLPRVKTHPHALLLLLLGLLVGCASAEPYVAAEPAPYRQSTRGYATTSADDGGWEAEPIAMTESVAPSGGGLFDFLDFSGVEVQGELARPQGQRVAQAPAPPPPPPAPGATPAPESEPAVVDDTVPDKRLLIYRATYNVLVANVDDSVQKLVTQAEAMGGYLQSRNDGTVTVRVPAARFFELTKTLGTFGTITNESLEALDVTKQYVDLALRLQTAERSRARLLELLKQATKMEDTLRIESELRRLTEEIETMKGELRLLQDQISFSTLTVRFFSNAPPPTPPSQRRASRFPWINAVGIEQVMYGF